VKTKRCTDKILPVVLHECETWSFIVTEEHGLRVFEEEAKIFGPKLQKVTGRWRRLNN